MTQLTLSEDSVQPEPLSDEALGALQRWMLSIACVHFDLELGPDVECMYPPLGISKEAVSYTHLTLPTILLV